MAKCVTAVWLEAGPALGRRVADESATAWPSRRRCPCLHRVAPFSLGHGRGPRLSSALRNVGHGSVERGRTGKLSEDATGSAIRVGAGGSTDR